MRVPIQAALIIAIVFLCKSPDHHSTKNEVINEAVKCTDKMKNDRLLEIMAEPDSMNFYLHGYKFYHKARLTKQPEYINENRLIFFLIGQIANAKEIPIDCECEMGLNVGDLALLSLHDLLDYPFSKATGRQVCYGKMISRQHQIPENFIYWSRGERERVIGHFIEYYFEVLDDENIQS